MSNTQIQITNRLQCLDTLTVQSSQPPTELTQSMSVATLFLMSFRMISKQYTLLFERQLRCPLIMKEKHNDDACMAFEVKVLSNQLPKCTI